MMLVTMCLAMTQSDVHTSPRPATGALIHEMNSQPIPALPVVVTRDAGSSAELSSVYHEQWR